VVFTFRDSHSSHRGFEEFGFSGLPGGGRNYDYGFGINGFFGSWWSISESDNDFAWMLGHNSRTFYGETDKEFGFSVPVASGIGKDKK